MAGKRAPSKHSRASRRATSPSINIDKSLKDVSLPSSSTHIGSSSSSSSRITRPSVLAARHSAGVSKKTSRASRKSRPSARAKRRQEKGQEMAEAVLERTGLKIEKSVGRARAVRARRKAWDDINKTVGEDNPGGTGSKEEGGSKGAVRAEESDDGTDEEMGGDEGPEAAPALQNQHAGDEDGDEEIL